MDLHNQFDPLGPHDPGYVPLSESDPASSPDHEMYAAQAEPQGIMEADCSFDYFARCLDNSSLPGDAHASGPFDNRCDFSLGDPGVDYEGTHKCEYATSGAVGEPHWSQIFCYLLQHLADVRFFNTVFVLVDNRDLTAPGQTRSPWHTGLLLRHGGSAGLPCMDLLVNYAISSTSPSVRQLGLNMCILPGQAHLCWLLLSFFSQGSTLCCWTAIVCQSPYLKLLIYGKKSRSSKMD